MIVSETRSSQERQSSFYGAVVMAAADGYIDDAEKRSLLSVAARLGLSDAEIEQVLAEPGTIDVLVPRCRTERALHVMDLLRVALADGDLDEEEMRFFITVARTYGFTPQDVMDMVDLVVCGATVDLIRVVYS